MNEQVPLCRQVTQQCLIQCVWVAIQRGPITIEKGPTSILVGDMSVGIWTNALLKDKDRNYRLIDTLSRCIVDDKLCGHLSICTWDIVQFTPPHRIVVLVLDKRQFVSCNEGSPSISQCWWCLVAGHVSCDFKLVVATSVQMAVRWNLRRVVVVVAVDVLSCELASLPQEWMKTPWHLSSSLQCSGVPLRCHGKREDGQGLLCSRLSEFS